MSKEIDCSYTDEIVCPHCGYTFQNSWEIADPLDASSEHEIECEECEKEFMFYAEWEVHYCSRKIIKLKNGN